MKIVFMGSPEFSVPSLETLHASHHEVVAVVTQPDRPTGRKLQMQPPAIKLSAHKLGLPVFQPETTKTQHFVDEIASFQPDVLVVVAYGEILRRNLLETAPRGAVNLHASLLPKYRGAAPIAWAILLGETETGATTMFMNEAMDAGPILLQTHCLIHPTDTTETLTKEIAVLGAPLLKQTIDLLGKGELNPRPQDETKINYAPKLKKEDGWIDWSKPAVWIWRQTRAMNPWPGTFSTWNQTLIKFWLAHPGEENTSDQPGTIIEVQKHALLVACGEGTVLHVLELQPENRARITAGDFIHGYSIRSGARFQSSPPMHT